MNYANSEKKETYGNVGLRRRWRVDEPHPRWGIVGLLHKQFISEKQARKEHSQSSTLDNPCPAGPSSRRPSSPMTPSPVKVSPVKPSQILACLEWPSCTCPHCMASTSSRSASVASAGIELPWPTREKIVTCVLMYNIYAPYVPCASSPASPAWGSCPRPQ